MGIIGLIWHPDRPDRILYQVGAAAAAFRCLSVGGGCCYCSGSWQWHAALQLYAAAVMLGGNRCKLSPPALPHTLPPLLPTATSTTAAAEAPLPAGAGAARLQGKGRFHFVSTDSGATYKAIMTPGDTLGFGHEIKVHPRQQDWLLAKVGGGPGCWLRIVEGGQGRARGLITAGGRLPASCPGSMPAKLPVMCAGQPAAVVAGHPWRC